MLVVFRGYAQQPVTFSVLLMSGTVQRVCPCSKTLSIGGVTWLITSSKVESLWTFLHGQSGSLSHRPSILYPSFAWFSLEDARMAQLKLRVVAVFTTEKCYALKGKKGEPNPNSSSRMSTNLQSPLRTFAVFWRNTEKSEAAMSLLWSVDELAILDRKMRLAETKF